MRPDFDEIRTLTKRFVLIPQKVAKFVFGVFRYADLSVLGDYKLRKAIQTTEFLNKFVTKMDFHIPCFFVNPPRPLASGRVEGRVQANNPY